MREMKDSGIEWIGKIPKEWSVCRVKNFYCSHKDIVGEKSDVYDRLALTLNGVVKRSKDDSVGLQPEAFNGYQILRSNELVFKLIDLANISTSRVGLSPYEGIVSPAYIILSPKTDFCQKFAEYYFLSMWQREVFNHLGDDGVRSSLNASDLLNTPFIYPPITEQKKIVGYLDDKCTEIEAVLEKSRASIDEYKKLKQSVITQAVTKGIRGDRPMKDSGIEWIGEIPDDWNTKKLKYISEIKQNKYSIKDGDLNYIGLENIIAWNGQYVSTNSIYDKEQSLICEPNDILFGKLRPYLAKVYIALERQCCSSEFCVISICDQNTKYIWYQLISHGFIFMVDRSTYGTKMPRANTDYLRNMHIVIPPFSEQQEIADYLDVKCTEIDNLISKKEQYINEIENYKKSLIYEYVTGKKECPAINQNDDVSNAYPYFPAPVHASSARFAQAVLMSKILEESSKGMGRVKLEKTLFTIENHIGFNFDTEYLREAAGPLDASIYECEKIITRRNKWFSMKTSSYGVSYAPTNDVDKYKKYYAKYFSEYNSEIERIIDVFRNYTTEQAEIIATLFAAWNDAIIDKKQFTDDDIVDDVLNNWHESKRRFPRQVWLRAMNEIRKNHIIPKGYGKHTVMKEMQ